MPKKSIIIFVCSFLSISFTFGQIVINNETTHFSIKGDSNQKIDFLVATTDLSIRKPIFLWFQGSQPVPLYVKTGDMLYLLGGGISNFDMEKIKETFHLVVISMPTVPLIVALDKLTSSYLYVPNLEAPNEPSDDFLRADYLENYINRANKVITFLGSRKWADTMRIVVGGHSQGARIAASYCLENRVHALGLFSPNPLSRITEMIRKPFYDAKNGTITWDVAEKQIDYYTALAKLIQNDTIVKNNPTLISWRSFSSDPILTWYQLDIPIYLAYGTEDHSADLCELVPYYFEKQNLPPPKMARYTNREHNFFFVENGTPNYQQKGWPLVIDNFLLWLEESN